VISLLVGITSVLLGGILRYLWRWGVRQYTNWRDRKEQAAEIEEWRQSLLTSDLSVAHGRFVGKRCWQIN
jgi:hypothetical protein